MEDCNLDASNYANPNCTNDLPGQPLNVDKITRGHHSDNVQAWFPVSIEDTKMEAGFSLRGETTVFQDEIFVILQVATKEGFKHETLILPWIPEPFVKQSQRISPGT